MTTKRRSRLSDIFPTCLGCGRLLRRSQVRWCSANCRALAGYWRKQLADYDWPVTTESRPLHDAAIGDVA